MNSNIDTLLHYALAMRDHRRWDRVPYRNQSCGAALITLQGDIRYAGNVEFKSARFSLCAEQLLLAKMKSLGESSIIHMLIVGDGPNVQCPCGICLQAMTDFPDFTVTMSNNNGSKMISKKVTELIPHAYGS